MLTAALVGVVAHAAIDGRPWAVAFALGAIVSPTDPLAATPITRRLGIPSRLTAVIEGESLINDALRGAARARSCTPASRPPRRRSATSAGTPRRCGPATTERMLAPGSS